jgi:hypothetical protein
LRVLTLEEYPVAQSFGQAAGIIQWCLDGYVIDTRLQNLLDISMSHGNAVP